MSPLFRREKPKPREPSPSPLEGEAQSEDGNNYTAGLRAIAMNTGPAISIGGGFANSGVYIDRSVRREAPRQPASWPYLVGRPPAKALGFQQRTQTTWLREALRVEGAAVVGQVLSGLGGVGKSQLVADYALTEYQAGHLDVLVWITAATRQAIIDGYARAAVELLASEPDEQAAQRFLAWLHPAPSRAACRWLVVLDDLSDPQDLDGLWPPASESGRTVVTTRRRDASLTGAGRRRVDVGVFTPTEAAAALHAALAERDHTTEPGQQIQSLVEDLGFLPLAISQAAAYIADAGLNVSNYRARLADRTRQLADSLPRPAPLGEVGDTLPDGQAATVAATWSLSLERADQLHPRGLARPMIQLAAMLDPNGIPQPVLTSEVARIYLTAHRTPPPAGPSAPPEPAQVDVEAAEAALRALHRLSLIDHNPDQATTAVRIHQLVQRTTREATSSARQALLARTVGDALLLVWPEIETAPDTGLVQALRANAAVLDQVAGDCLYLPDAHAVLFRYGRSLGEIGQVNVAINHFHQLHVRTAAQLGPDHPDTLTARNNLAYFQGKSGDAAGAAEANAELLKDQLRVLGPDHPDTLTTRYNLARWQGLGDPTAAADTYAELLKDHLRVLGPDHPETLRTRSNLAHFRGEAGDAAGAADAYAELLKDHLRTLGPDHPDTLSTRNNLAAWQAQSNVADAIATYADLLRDRERILGPDHPDTLTTRGNLAHVRGEAGDAAGAAIAYAELLPELARVLGSYHPTTLTYRDNLAIYLGETGDAAGAADAYAELLKGHLRTLGPDHPDTLHTRNSFALFRGKAGDSAGAADTYADLVLDLTRVLGPNHPDTLTARNNLAHFQGKAGDAAGAVDAYAELLPQMLRELGPNHPVTLTTRGNLARFRGEAGDAAGAVDAYAELLPQMLRELGPNHSLTQIARDQFAHWKAISDTSVD